MSGHIHDWIEQHKRPTVCDVCGELKRDADLADAVDAIVDAADKHHDYLPHTVRVAVDAWRKLKGM